MASRDKTVFTKGYDLAGNTLPRQFGHWIKIKTQIMGNYDTGPGLICLLRLLLLHKLGKPLFALKIWLANQYALKARVRGLINKLKPQPQVEEPKD